MRRTRGKSWSTPTPVGMRPSTSNRYRVKGPVRGQTRPSVYSDLYQRRRRRWPFALVVMGAAVLIIGLVVALAPLSGAPADESATAPETEGAVEMVTSDTANNSDASGLAPLVMGEGMETGSGPGRLSFCAVGDNVLNEPLLTAADAAAGEVGDGTYDFAPLLAAITPTIANDYDVAFINQETVLGGDEEFPFAGYPSFNSPDAVAEALADGGWDVINCNSNHMFDIGPKGIRHELELWKSYPDVMTIGMFETADEAQRIRMVERNGVRVAFLSYTYGLNGYEAAEEGMFVAPETDMRYDLDGSLVNLITETKLARDIPKAKEVADAVVVSMHFGEEYSHTPDDYERQWAQRCADLGADVVLGTHTHFIQPIEWIAGEGGNETLVAWCLGDLASGYGWIDASLGGMVSFDFIKGDDGSVTIEDLTWTPTIEHLENGAYSVHFLKDYTAEQAARNEQYTVGSSLHNTQEMVADVRAYAQSLSETVMGQGITIDGLTAESAQDQA